VTPRQPRHFEFEVRGLMTVLTGAEVFPDRSAGAISLVAEVRYIAKPTLAEALFSYRRAA
jgi:hypothetical protein